ncbi:MAG: hypothetical protein ACLS3V_02725 [Streptococcus sp.]
MNVTGEANTSTLKLVNCLTKKNTVSTSNGGTGSSADSTNTNVTINGDKNAFMVQLIKISNLLMVI